MDEINCFLVSDPIEKLYRDLGALFCAPVHEEIVLFHGDSVGIVKTFEHTLVSGTITNCPDTNIRETAIFKLLDMEAGSMKKGCHRWWRMRDLLELVASL